MGALGELRTVPGFIAVEPGGEDAVDVGAGADEEEDDEEEGLEFQDAEHSCRLGVSLKRWDFVWVRSGMLWPRRVFCGFP